MKAQRSQSWALIRAKWLFAQVVDPLLTSPHPSHRHPLHAAALDKKLKSLEPWAWNLQLIVSHTHTKLDSWSSQVTHLARVCVSATTTAATTTLSFSQQQQHTNNNACLLSRIALFKFVFRKYLRDARFLFRIFFLTFFACFFRKCVCNWIVFFFFSF